MSNEDTLPPFPTDDATLAAVEHALGGVLTYEPECGYGPPLDEPRRIGADYSLQQVLDFAGGTIGDPDGVVVQIDDINGLPAFLDERPHYTERDVIAALITEVRRLRDEEQV
ncbi:MAG: hypothetical protein AB7W59_15510 [Acidimicrobiia bacterium]